MRNYEFKLTPAYCLYNGIAVVNQEGSHICFMTEKPSDQILKDRLIKAFDNYVKYVLRQKDCPSQFRSSPSVVFVDGNRNEVRKYVSKLYSFTEEDAGRDAAIEKPVMSVEQKQEEEAAAVILLDTILADARSRNATDIHIEKNCIRFRIYGNLETVSFISESKAQELIQRIKFLAGMNVLEKRRSQDGQFVYGTEEPVFVRVSVMGIIGRGRDIAEESVVIRLLDTKRLPLALDKLGFTQIQTEKIRKITEEKNGLIIICGPTGAGKSTTAAAVLLDIEKRRNNSVKIVSLEDPPEYVIPGITQIQIDEKMDNSFSEALRHVFRQDPDILMIGEIRDEASAAVALRAALTGHLVLATLHTSTAAAAVFRLEDLGLPRNMILSVLKGVVVQDLKSVGGNINLAADVSIPDESINKAMNKDLVETELEKFFEHNTNYMQVLEKTIGVLKQKHTDISSADEQKVVGTENKPEKLKLTKRTPGLKKGKKQLLVPNKKSDDLSEAAI